MGGGHHSDHSQRQSVDKSIVMIMFALVFITVISISSICISDDCSAEEKKDLDNTIIEPISDQTYTGSSIEPTLIITDNDTKYKLIKDTDYTVVFTGNIDVGVASAAITGINNYSGVRNITFTIVARDISDPSVEISFKYGSVYTYTGNPIEPEITVEFNGKTLTSPDEYLITSYTDNVNAGTSASVDIQGLGNFIGNTSAIFEIEPRDISDAVIDSIPDQAYTGGPLEPALSIKCGGNVLTADLDYTAEYSDNIHIGTAYVVITAEGNYTGTRDTTFTVIPRDINETEVKAIPEQTYTGGPIEPTVTVKDGDITLVLGTDFTVVYQGNINVGDASVQVTGMGNYDQSRIEYFYIAQKPITVTADDSNKRYNENDPVLTATVEGTVGAVVIEYTVSRETGEEVGTYEIMPSGPASQGNYSVTYLPGKFTITKSINLTSIDSIGNQVYTKEPITPEVTIHDGAVALEEGTDYTVEYSDNTNVGTATVKITGIGYYYNDAEINFTITAKSIVSVTVDPIEDQIYCGSAFLPDLVIKDGDTLLENNKDYVVSGKDNVNAGTATLTIDGKGNYRDFFTVHFTINKAKASAEFFDYKPPSNLVYDGKEKKAEVTVKTGISGTGDYIVSYSDNIGVGNCIVTVTVEGGDNLTPNEFDIGSFTITNPPDEGNSLFGPWLIPVAIFAVLILIISYIALRH